MIDFIRIYSDLHLEFGDFQIPELDTDNTTALLLAGDIHVKYGILKDSWLSNLSKRFAKIFYVFGNHEHYKSSLDLTIRRVREKINALGLTNVFILDNESQLITENVKIFGGTMWTDYNNHCPLTLSYYNMNTQFNDYKQIRNKSYGRKFSPAQAIGEHLLFRNRLEEELAKPFDGNIIVMTHHSPCSLSIADEYRGDTLGNGGYVVDMTEYMLDNPKIKMWVHGHLHNNSDYMVGDCRVICNPRGYCPSDLNKNFIKTMVLPLT